MEQVKLVSFVVLLVLLCVTQNGRFAASNPVSSPSEAGEQLVPSEENKPITDRIVSYVCIVTNLFLEKVVQRHRLTKMVSVVDMSNVLTFLGSLRTSWNDWTTYLIGFVVLFALFLVLGIVTIIFDIIYLFCRFRGNCGNSAKSEQREPSSKAGTIVCSVAVGLIVGAIAMFTTNEAIRTELSENVFDNLIKGVERITEYLDLAIRDVNDTIFGGFLRLEDIVFGVLQNAPTKATETIVNSTLGVLNNLNQLKNFTRQLDTLKKSFLDSQNVTQVFSRTAGQLTDALKNLRTWLSACSFPLCDLINGFLGESSSGGMFNLDALNIRGALQATSDSNGLDRLVNFSLSQLTGVHSLMNVTMSFAVKGLKTTTKGVKFGLSTMISTLNETLRGIVNVAPIRELVLVVKQLKLYNLLTELTYWFLFALAYIVGIIVLLDLLGLMMGLCLPSNHNPTSGTSCGCTKCIGSYFLMTGTALTLIFYWIFALLVAALFISGGPIHTEVCRNIVHNNHSDSIAVLSIFDEWVVGLLKLSPLRIKPFQIYSVCQNDRPIYEAFELTQIVNLSQITNCMSMLKEIEESFGGITGKLPGSNLASPDLTGVLGTLTSALGESTFNFTKFYAMIEGNSVINNIALSLNNADIFFLKPIYQQSVVPLLAQRDRLLTLMRSAEAILSQISFTNVTKALAKADAIMKNAIPTFLNSTTGSILVEIEKYVTGVLNNVMLELGRCRPVHVALKTVVDALCVDLLYPINGFWFSLGWCTLFLIPKHLPVSIPRVSFQCSSLQKCVGYLD